MLNNLQFGAGLSIPSQHEVEEQWAEHPTNPPILPVLIKYHERFN